MMQGQILDEANDAAAEGHFNAEQTYLCIDDQYFWKEMWRDTQQYIAGCDLCQ